VIYAKNKKHHRFKNGWCLMGGKRLPEGERKEPLTVHIKGKLKDEIRKIPGYNRIIEKLIEEYLKKNKD
jgi:hypothetical protein